LFGDNLLALQHKAAYTDWRIAFGV
jgi:hypothetical protein